MKNPSIFIIAKLIAVLAPSLAFAQTQFEQQLLDNQQRLIQIQQQQLNIAQTAENERIVSGLTAKRNEEAETWAWFSSLPKNEKQEIIDDWNKTRPDCPFPCPSGRAKP